MRTATVREDILLANQRFMKAFSQRDAAALSRCYTEQAQLLPPQSEPVYGRTAIEAFWNAVIGTGITAVKLETLELTEFDNFACEVGRYSLAAADGRTIDHGKYVVLWHLDGGQWRLHRDIWNTSVASSA